MENQKLEIKVGDHEFRAEGPTEVVQAQFEAWSALVRQIPTAAEKPRSPDAAAEAGTNGGTTTDTTLPLDTIMRTEGRYVSLTARGASLEDEVLLILYGQKMLKQNDSVSGAEVMEGLKMTGHSVTRADYQLDKLTTRGDVITIGVGRARRYRLTNAGASRCRELARSLIAVVA